MKIQEKWLILSMILIVTFMSTLDGSIINVALPIMTKKLGVSTSEIQIIVTSYLITISALILIFGRLGDMIGKRKMFKFGLVIFTLGSLLCGFSRSLIFLVFARIIQGIGAAGVMANNQGIITETFPPAERGKALGLSGTAVALGSLVGPPLGGLIISISSWEYIFLINVPIGILALIYSLKVLPNIPLIDKASFDKKGAFLYILSIVLIFGALDYGQVSGFKNLGIIISIIIAVIVFIIFIVVEKKEEKPLLDLSIFNNSLFSVSIVCAFISFMAIFCSNIILPFYLQNAKGYTPAKAGLILMIYPLILTVVAPISGHISDKIGSEKITFLGLLFTSTGLFLLSFSRESTSLLYILFSIIVMSFGNGMFQSPNNSLIMSQVPKEKLGIAGSINGLIRNLGMVTGIAFSTLLLYNRMSAKFGQPVNDFIEGRSDIFIYGMKFVYVSASLICLFGALLTLYRIKKLKKSHI